MIYTSYFGNIKKIAAAYPNAVLVSIAGKCPDWYVGLQYKVLAPKYDWWKEWHDKFKDDPDSADSQLFYSMKYAETVLNKLDPHEVKCKLYEMANSRMLFLLCYETPEKFCHRQLVREWLNSNGIQCKEWSIVKDGTNENQD